MDPYLEDPAIWSGFHHTFLSKVHEQLAPQLRPKYFVRVEERVYVTNEADPAYRVIVPDLRVIHTGQTNLRQSAPRAGSSAIAEMIPVGELIDSEIHEHRLEVLDRVDRSVVAVFEVLSPTNKIPGAAGRNSFLQKRKEVFSSSAHWIEIDLLREGSRTANFAQTVHAEYQLYMSRAGEPRSGYVLPISLREPLPTIGMPLKDGDADVPLDLQAALTQVYELCGYDMDFDYARDPNPPLPPDAAEWARNMIAAGQSASE
jgi:hypothetical protein